MNVSLIPELQELVKTEQDWDDIRREVREHSRRRKAG